MKDTVSTLPPKSSDLVSRLFHFRYHIVAAVLFLLVLINPINQDWHYDFAEHAAVVRELQTQPSDPQHPILLVDKPHPFYSPYSLLVGLIARTFGTPSYNTLSYVGLLNAIFLFIGLFIFVKRLFPNRYRATAFYSLIFILLLWGPLTWDWSGFFHIRVFKYILPYPACFASALMFVIWAAQIRNTEKASWLRWLGIWVGTLVILLTHPTTAIVTFIGLLGLAGGMNKTLQSAAIHVVLTGVMIVLAFAATKLYPYYSFLGLLSNQSPDFHEDTKVMYENVLIRVFPFIILGIVALIPRLKKNWRDPLALVTVGLLFIYAYGYISGSWGYGRIISHVAIVLQITFAGWVAGVEQRLPKMPLKLAPMGASLVVGVLLAFPGIKDFLRSSFKPESPLYESYAFLNNYTSQYDVVLTDLENSWYVPAIGGKVVASKHPVYWVDDYIDRRKDLETFFLSGTNNSFREELLTKYGADFVLIDKEKYNQPNLTESIGSLGNKVYEDEKFTLIEIL